jgi:hypothetical protein
MHFSPLLSTVKAIKALFINKTAVHRTSCLLDNVVRIEIKKTCGLLIFLSSHFALQNVRIGRIELPSHPWQGCVLPLNHIRVTNSKNITYLWSQVEFVRQQIRSRPRLAILPLQNIAAPSTKAQNLPQGRYLCFCAPTRTRTWNNWFEASRDIHFTTGAWFYSQNRRLS